MNSIKVSKKSSTFWLACRFGSISEWDIRDGYVDSCTYNREVIKSVIVLSIMLAMSVFILSLPADFIAWMASWIVSGTLPQPSLPSVLFMFFTFIGLVTWAALQLDRVFHGKFVRPSDTELYRSFKQKYCKPVTMEEENPSA